VSSDVLPPDDADPETRPTTGLSRRTVLRGALTLGAVGVAGGLVLPACGGDDSSDDDASGDSGSGAEGSGGEGGAGEGQGDLVLVTMTNTAASLAAGAEARVPFGLGDDSGTLVKDAPDSLTFDVLSVEDGDAVVAEGLVVERHDSGLERAYFPLVFTPAAPGYYTAVTTLDGAEVQASFQIVAEDAIVIPRPGQPFPVVATPTTEDARGVDPICTRDPQCPFHQVDLSTAVGSGPVAVLVSTPAFCQTAICGPVLDIFEAASADRADITFIHVEVFASAEEVEEAGPEASLAPAVEAWELPFEPCLFLVAADGTLQRRLDVIYDEVELADGLDELAV
jgi:hypothetical protein